MVDETTTAEANTDDEIYAHCRIAIFGAQRLRVAKVASLLHAANDDDDDESFDCVPLPTTATTAVTNNDKVRRKVVKIDYLPCVATFDSYKNEETGETIKYLAKVEYHGPDGKQPKGSSLAPFFDSNDDDDDDKTSGTKKLRFEGVSAVAIGCGIEGEEDVSMIEMFVRNLSGASAASLASTTSDEPPLIVVECITPNSEYKTMKEENEAYKALEEEKKMEMTDRRTMGPGKMAKFVSDLGRRVVLSAIDSVYGTSTTKSDVANDSVADSDTDGNVVTPEKPIEEEEEHESLEEANKSMDEKKCANEKTLATTTTTTTTSNATPITPILRDPNAVQYACKRCRTILFEEKDLEDPPHRAACHDFRRRKGGGGTASQRGANACENVFLAEEMNWMGDISAFEGKLNCPKCSTKVGHWKWAGSQCSCGTWVTPAIQIPLGRVDVIRPLTASDLAASSISPVGFANVVSPVVGR